MKITLGKFAFSIFAFLSLGYMIWLLLNIYVPYGGWFPTLLGISITIFVGICFLSILFNWEGEGEVR